MTDSAAMEAGDFLPHLEMIRDTLRDDENSLSTSDASIRTLEYATESILLPLEEANEVDKWSECCKYLLKKSDTDGESGVETLLKCLKTKSSSHDISFNVAKILHYISSTDHQHSTKDKSSASESFLPNLVGIPTKEPASYTLPKNVVIDVLIEMVTQHRDISNELLNLIHVILNRLSPLEREFTEKAHETNMIQVTVSLLTRMVAHTKDVPPILSLIQRFMQSNGKDRKKKRMEYAQSLVYLGYIDVCSRILKRYSNEVNNETSLQVLKLCISNLNTIIKNENSGNSKAAGCVNELVGVIVNLNNAINTANYQYQHVNVSIQSAVVTVLKIAIKLDSNKDAFRNADGMKQFYDIIINKLPKYNVWDQRFVYIYCSMCEILYKCLMPVSLSIPPTPSQYSSGSSESLQASNGLKFKLRELPQVRKTSGSVIALSEVFLQDVARELNRENIVYTTVYEYDANFNDCCFKFQANEENCNIRKVTKIRDYEFDMETIHDMEWFMFKLTIVKPVMKLCRFNIITSCKKSQHFLAGIPPLIYSSVDETWERIGQRVFCYKNHFNINESEEEKRAQKRQNHFTYTFTVDFSRMTVGNSYYIAYGYPYTHSMLMEDAKLLGNSDILFDSEDLCSTILGHSCPAFTITSREEKPNKDYVFLMARVNCEETNSSWALKGAIEFLMSSDEIAKQLRDKFIFKIVPMIDPDGVIYGSNSSFHDRTITIISHAYRKISEQNKMPLLLCEFKGQYKQVAGNKTTDPPAISESTPIYKRMTSYFSQVESSYKPEILQQQPKIFKEKQMKVQERYVMHLKSFHSTKNGYLPVTMEEFVLAGRMFCEALNLDS